MKVLQDLKLHKVLLPTNVQPPVDVLVSGDDVEVQQDLKLHHVEVLQDLKLPDDVKVQQDLKLHDEKV